MASTSMQRATGLKSPLYGAYHVYIDLPTTRLNLTGTKPVNFEMGPDQGDYTFLDIRYAHVRENLFEQRSHRKILVARRGRPTHNL